MDPPQPPTSPGLTDSGQFWDLCQLQVKKYQAKAGSINQTLDA